MTTTVHTVDRVINVLDTVIAEWTEDKYCAGKSVIDAYGFVCDDVHHVQACRWCALGYIERCASSYALFYEVLGAINECLVFYGTENIDVIDINDKWGWYATHQWLQQTRTYLEHANRD